MIASLRGQIIARDGAGIILDVGGVGFRIMLSTQSLAALADNAAEVSLLTSMIVREDAISLYGFGSEREKQLFEKLITVSGIGPKVAMSALSSFSAETLLQIISTEDVQRMSTVSGIGKKTAQRIILELKGALDFSELGSEAAATASGSAVAMATEALLGMGFSGAEVELALSGNDAPTAETADLVRYALKRLGAL